jgi:hypothetical protein
MEVKGNGRGGRRKRKGRKKGKWKRGPYFNKERSGKIREKTLFGSPRY